MSWADEASCRPTPGTNNTNMFFSSPRYSEALAKSFCVDCTVRQECLDYAMSTEANLAMGRYRYGVWGGMTPKERQELSLSDERYAVRPTELSDLEVSSICEEIDMQVKFRYTTDGHPRGEAIEMSDAMGKRYVDSGHAIEVKETIEEAPAAKAKPPAKPKAGSAASK